MKRHLMSAMGLGLFVTLAVGSDDSKTGGTLLGNQMDAYALEYIDSNGILEPGEQIRAYYDVTIALDSSEFAMVTDQRVVYWKAGHSSAIHLNEIATIDVRDEGLIGTVIDVKAEDGTPMRIEVAPMNGGELFAAELQSAWDASY